MACERVDGKVKNIYVQWKMGIVGRGCRPRRIMDEIKSLYTTGLTPGRTWIPAMSGTLPMPATIYEAFNDV